MNPDLWRKNKVLETYKKTELDQSHIQLSTQVYKLKQKKLENTAQQFLKRIIFQTKVSNYVKIYAQKLKHNISCSPIPNINVAVLQTVKQQEMLKQKLMKGVDYPQFVQFFIQFTYIISILVLLFFGTLLGFIPQFYQKAENYRHPATIALLSASILLSFLGIIYRLTDREKRGGRNLQLLKEIILYNLTSFSFYINVFVVIIGIVTVIVPYQRAAGITLFMICLLNIKNVREYLQDFELKFYNFSHKFKYEWKLMKIFIFNIFFAHIISTSLLLIADFNSSNWIQVHSLDIQPWYVLYFYTFYWAVTIMMTVGFGDFSATNWQETVGLAVIQLVSVMVLAYIISEVGSILKKLSQKKKVMRQNTGIFYRMNLCLRKPIEKDLEDRIMSYLNQQQRYEAQTQQSAKKQFLQGLPPKLSEGYFSEVNKALFKSLPIFQNFSKDTLVDLSSQLTNTVFIPNETIGSRQFGFEKLFIFKKGTVGFAFKRKYWKDNGLIMQQLSRQSDEIPILLNQNLVNPAYEITYDVIAKTYCDFYEMNFDQFYSILRRHQLDMQMFFQHCHRVECFPIIQNINCEFCLQRKHSVFECPRLHYRPYKSIVIAKHIFGSKQQIRKTKKNTRAKEKLTQTSPWKNYRFFKRFQEELQKVFASQRSVKISKLKISSEKAINQQVANELQFLGKEIKSLDLNLIMNYRHLKEKLNFHCRTIQARDQENYQNLQIDKAQNYIIYFARANPNRLLEEVTLKFD